MNRWQKRKSRKLKVRGRRKGEEGRKTNGKTGMKQVKGLGGLSGKEEELESPAMLDEIKDNIEGIIDQRLSELTPQLVKEMVQKMIKEHLGWLVVWGGVFGGVIGIISTFIA